MDDELGFHLRRSQVAAFKHFAQTVTATEGITPGLYGMLQVIANTPGLTQSALAEAMDVDRSSIVKVVNQLVDKGLITRDPVPNDRRSYNLRMTAGGKLALRRIEDAVMRQDREFSAALSDAERATLISLLKRLCR
ncbi:MAG: MarR family transcriptional regulator [Magnetospirillum sp.]|nr:MAG: MarR family transcriptional regulator [Magnetospirillum sp.]